MTFSDEAAFLLNCSGIQLSEARVEHLRRRVAVGVDWGEIIRLAIPHGLLPLVAMNLTKHAADIVPALTMAQLALFRRRVDIRNRHQMAELMRVATMLGDAKIRVLPFKGPLLAFCAYGDLSLRESHDLDLWVHPSDLPAAGNLLRASGYRAAAHLKGTPALLEVDPGEGHTDFLSSDGSVFIEIQGELQTWELSFWPEFDEVWGRSKPVTAEGTTIPSLADEDLLLTLAVHGSKHMWRRLSWVVDVVALLQSNLDLDWNLTLRRAEKWHCKRRLFCSTALADRLYGLPLPEFYRIESRKHAYTRRSVSNISDKIVEGVGARTIRNYLSELRHHLRNADKAGDVRRLLYAYLCKIWRADESAMVRSMPMNTLILFRIFTRIRSAIARTVKQN